MGKLMNINKGKYGIGTSALIIAIFSMMFSFSSLGDKSIGEEILKAIGVRFPAGIISIILFTIAVYIGHKYREDYGAKAGRNVAIFFILLMAILTLISLFY